MLTRKKHKPSCKIWIEYKGKPVLGKGGAEILEEIERENSISRTAEKLGMSYRYVWNYLRKMQKSTGEPIVETYRGGKSGGGGAKLTELGKSLLEEYKRLEGYLSEVLSDTEYWEVLGLKISARNRLKGRLRILRRFYDVRVGWRSNTLPCLSRSLDWRCFKDKGIDTLFPQDTFRAPLSLQGANNPFEGMTENPAEGRPFVLR